MLDARVDQLGDPREVGGVVGPCPLAAHQRIVLGRVDEAVHAALADEPDHVESLLVRPGTAVEPLDDPALREGGRAGLADAVLPPVIRAAPAAAR